jgi:hypothetical protein
MKFTVSKLMLSALLLAVPISASASELTDNLQWKGDIRLRSEAKNVKDAHEETRARYRFRLGATTQVEDTKVEFGFASGDSNPRSTNFTADANKKSTIVLDKAFITHKLSSEFSVMAGKMTNPLWRPTDLIWDTDINPDGAVVKYNPNCGKEICPLQDRDVYAILGVIPMDVIAQDRMDPKLVIAQVVGTHRITDSSKLKMGISYYDANSVQTRVLENSSNSNSLLNGGLEHKYQNVVLSGEYTRSNLGHAKNVTVFSEYVTNQAIQKYNRGFIWGLKVGDKKVNKRGDWQIQLSQRSLEKDAVLDTLPDADSLSGKTASKGEEFILSYGLAKNIALSLDMIQMRNIDSDEIQESLAQIDLSIKF